MSTRSSGSVNAGEHGSLNPVLLQSMMVDLTQVHTLRARILAAFTAAPLSDCNSLPLPNSNVPRARYRYSTLTFSTPSIVAMLSAMSDDIGDAVSSIV